MESDKPSQGGQVNIEEAVLQGLGISNGSPSGGDAEEQSLDPATTEEPDRYVHAVFSSYRIYNS